ncbi:MAG: AAA family ATPase [Bryobacteraceae bacterium]|nr:AAA family ATPase [Bryobacteraceae bacterium]
MRTTNLPSRIRRGGEETAYRPPAAWEEIWESKLVGQPSAIRTIRPFVRLFDAGLSMEGRPAGVFLLLGPTGTGKTRTVEALAEALHGSEKSLLRIDCGEFQMEHEVAKLIGAPPGYLGHRETPPMLTQQKIASVASGRSGLSIVLFDEIEKAAASMARLLLGVLDKAQLRLGDNTTVNFERTLIFLTSNLGASNMTKALRPGFGFEGMMAESASPGALRPRLEAIALRAVRRKFSPEFLNRIDGTVTYQPLDRQSFEKVLDLELAAIERHIERRLGARAFRVTVTARARRLLLERGTSVEFGARELKRTLNRLLLQPLAGLVADERIDPDYGATLDVERGEAVMAPAERRAA